MAWWLELGACDGKVAGSNRARHMSPNCSPGAIANAAHPHIMFTYHMFTDLHKKHCLNSMS